MSEKQDSPCSPTASNDGSQGTGDLERQSKLEEGAETEEQAPPSGTTAHLPPWRLTLVVLSLCIGTLLVAIDTTIVSTAIPHIATDFKALDDVGWYGSAYLFTVTAFQPAFGSIYRFFDAKWAYLSSVVLFESQYILIVFHIVPPSGQNRTQDLGVDYFFHMKSARS